MDLWVKAFHIIAVISWMASLLYLPRLFVYHCGAETGSVQSETFKVMERRLLKAIATPSMIATWIFGLWIASLYDVWADPWFMIKLVCVLLMTVMHFLYAKCARSFATDSNRKGEKYYRVINEVPAVLMIIIVIMVVVKPF
ncbi:MAG: protoporphyrinogen oxidase HemJ [Rhizobiaceae bacterium]|nr:protoporphyrinogen oxidase HemJ [Rhizobiaceae bacterium]